MPEVAERSRIQLCGRLSVEIDGSELAGVLRGRQVPLLFAYLVLNRERPIGREELIGAMWPLNGPQSQDAAIRTLLSRLRSALGHDVLIGRDELILVLPEPAWVDVEAAATELERAQRALDGGDARAAWGLAQVPLNVAGRGLLAGAAAEWLEAPRRELADIRLRSLEVIGRAGLALSGTQLGSAERAARALIDAEPYRESGYVLLMQALEAQGNVAEALRVFERLRALLRDELGAPPSAEALAAHQRLLRPSAPPRPGPTQTGRTSLPLPAELAVAASAPLAGRAGDLEALHGWWSSGVERMLLLSGEPGVGKTRLLAELAGRAHAEGALVLAGGPPEESIAPYQPFLEALGRYVLGAPLQELRAVTADHGPELARLIVALRERIPELPVPDRGDPETERWRLFEAVAGLLERVSAPAPVLIVIDDLHWSDRPTLRLLRHLLRSPRSQRVRIAGAYRASDRWSDGFELALAGLRRDRLARELEVAGLAEPEAAELVLECVGGVAPAELTAALYELTEGNPFYIKQILSHLADTGLRLEDAGAAELAAAGLPDDVRGVISRRLQRLDPATLQWLRAASVVGRDFESHLLEQVTESDEERSLAAIDEALAAGLVTEAHAPGRLNFSHQLIRETLYESMSAARRASIHHRVGIALERAGEGERAIGALALHFARGGGSGDAERAIRYSLAAGEGATEMLAYEEAAGHYARALEALDRLAPGDIRRRCDLLLELGEARVRSGERRLAWAALREAASAARRLGDSAAVARAVIAASRPYLQPPGVVDEELIELLEDALARSAGQRTLTRVRLLNCLCGALYFSERRERMQSLSREATELAKALHLPEATAVAAAAG
ncbi:MAG: ATP-binding protein, partial [Solirubrobacteraceae bacterium]